MHTCARKYPRYALAGGKGRRSLFLFDTADRVSVRWAKLIVENQRFSWLAEAREALGGAYASLRADPRREALLSDLPAVAESGISPPAAATKA